MRNYKPKKEDGKPSFSKQEDNDISSNTSQKSFSKKTSFTKRESSSKYFSDKKTEASSSNSRKFNKEGSEFSKTLSDRKPFGNKRSNSSENFERKTFVDKRNSSNKFQESTNAFEKPKRFSDDKPFSTFKKKDESGRPTSNDRKFAFSKEKPRFQKHEPHARNPFERSEKTKNISTIKENQAASSRADAPNYNLEKLKNKLPEKVQKKVEKEEQASKINDLVRLNRFIANAGIASRRDADELIASGKITVNGKIITEMGYKVKPNDVVKFDKKVLSREKLVYVLLNKPKDFITTTDDPDERRTVMDLVKNACSERIYPVGRLDRNTTGLLLLTNDGELAEKLSHPSHEIKKIYQVELNKPISEADFETILNGIELEDGFIKPDELALVTPDAEVVGIKIHSGKNRIVRRIFEHLGYEVLKLDRTTYAGLDKKDLPRGKWRFLTEKEVIRLKFML